MLNQLRAECYKLLHTKALYITLLLIAIVYVIFSVGGEQMFLTAGYVNTPGQGDSIGFISRVYAEPSAPVEGELVRTAMSYTIFFWIIALIFAVLFYTREMSASTMKIAIAGGRSRATFFFAKFLTIAFVTLFCYTLFVVCVFVIECRRMKVLLTWEVLQPFCHTLGLNLLVFIAFLSLTLMLCVLFRQTAIVVVLVCFFLFSGALITMSSFGEMTAQPWGVLIYLFCNPIYYWMRICGYDVSSALAHGVLIYTVLSTLLTLGISLVKLVRQDIR